MVVIGPRGKKVSFLEKAGKIGIEPHQKGVIIEKLV